MIDVDERRSWSFYILELVSDNPYNPTHQVARVTYKGRRIDLRVYAGMDNPNPQDHLMLVMASEKVMDTEEVSKDRWGLLPGLASSDGRVASIPQGFCFPIDKRQKINTSSPQNASAAFAVSNTNMFDKDNIVASMSPRFGDRDYTTIDKSGADPTIGSVGLFINKQGTILLKSTGGSITIGKEGIHIGGQLHQESSTANTGPLSDNTIADLVPSTVVTFEAAYPKVLNNAFLTNVARSGMKFIDVVDKGMAGGDVVTAIREAI